MKSFLAALFCLPLLALAQTSAVPGLISYQSRVADSAGTPLGTSTPVSRLVAFRIYDAPSGGNRLFSEQQTVVFSGGDFSALIGSGSPIAADTGNPSSTLNAALFAGAARYLGITIDGGDGNLANDTELPTRQRLLASAFGFRSQMADAVAPGGISASAMAASSVTPSALAANAVTSTKLATAAVGTAQLADGSVTAGKLAAGAVQTSAIADGAVTAAKIAAGAIEAAALADGAITLAKLAANSIDSTKIVDGSIAAADLAASAVDTTKIAAGAATLAKNAANSVDASKLAAGAVTLADLAPASVDASKIVDGSVGQPELTPSVRSGLPKQRVIYNQAVFPDYVTARTKGSLLIPLELKDLGNDADGCRIEVIAQHKVSLNDWRCSTFTLFLEQPGFVTDPDFPNLVWGRTRHTESAGVASANFRLNLATWAQGNNFVGQTANSWVGFFTAYPGSLRSGETPPFNQNIDNNTTEANAGGPAVSFAITSIVVGTNTLTITLNNPHAITEVGEAVTLAGISGGATPNGSRLVTVIPDRMSFTVALTGATGAYSGGTATHKPRYSKFRIWAHVHPDVSARIIIYDR